MKKNNYPTPHINATPNDFAKTVLMPGDPLRAKFIAETFLEEAKLINNVRGIQGYTGKYNGEKLSVMASGMGMPSMGIYSYELYNFFDIENIIRIGSAGALTEKVKIKDIVFGQGACTDSNYASQFGINGTVAPIADYHLLKTAIEEAEKIKASYHVGNVYSTDVFYYDDSDVNNKWARLGVMAVEMEAAALYLNAMKAGKKALAICTISDHLVTGEALSVEERQTSFTQMMEIALNTAIRL